MQGPGPTASLFSFSFPCSVLSFQGIHGPLETGSLIPGLVPGSCLGGHVPSIEDEEELERLELLELELLELELLELELLDELEESDELEDEELLLDELLLEELDDDELLLEDLLLEELLLEEMLLDELLENELLEEELDELEDEEDRDELEELDELDDGGPSIHLQFWTVQSPVSPFHCPKAILILYAWSGSSSGSLTGFSSGASGATTHGMQGPGLTGSLSPDPPGFDSFRSLHGTQGPGPTGSPTSGISGLEGRPPHL